MVRSTDAGSLCWSFAHSGHQPQQFKFIIDPGEGCIWFRPAAPRLGRDPEHEGLGATFHRSEVVSGNNNGTRNFTPQTKKADNAFYAVKACLLLPLYRAEKIADVGRQQQPEPASNDTESAETRVGGNDQGGEEEDVRRGATTTACNSREEEALDVKDID